MPVVSRVIRGRKAEEMLRQETLAKIDARKARIAAATAKLVEMRTPKPKSKQVQKVTAPAAIVKQNLAGTTTAENSATAVPAAGTQSKVLLREERAVTVSAAIKNHHLAGTTTPDNSDTAVPAAEKQSKVFVREKRAVAVPTALSNKGISTLSLH